MDIEIRLRSIRRCPSVIVCEYYKPNGSNKERVPLFSELRAGFVLQPAWLPLQFNKFQRILDQLAQQPGIEIRKYIKSIPLMEKSKSLSTEAMAVAFWLFLSEPLSFKYYNGKTFHQAVLRFLIRLNKIVGVLEPVCELETLIQKNILSMWLSPKAQKGQPILFASPAVRQAIRPRPLPLKNFEQEVFRLQHVPETAVNPIIPHQYSENVVFQLGLADNRQVVGLPDNWRAPLLIAGGSTKERIQLASYLILEFHRHFPEIPQIFVLDGLSVFNGLIDILSKNEVQEWRLGQNLSLDLSHMPNCDNDPSERASWLARLVFASVSDPRFLHHFHTFEEQIKSLDEQSTFQEMYDEFVARDTDQRYAYAEIRSLLSAFLHPSHHVTAPALGDILRGAPITVLQPGNQSELIKRYFQFYCLFWLISEAPEHSIIVIDRLEAIIPHRGSQNTHDVNELFQELLLKADRRNIRLVLLSATSRLSWSVSQAAENRVYLHLTGQGEQGEVLMNHAITDNPSKMALLAGKQALFVQEEASNKTVFFNLLSFHPKFGKIIVKTRLNSLERVSAPKRERFFRPDQYHAIMTVLEEAVKYPRISANQIQNLIESFSESSNDLPRWLVFLDSTGLVEQRQMGGVQHYVVTEMGREYYIQQMNKIRTWPAPIRKQELKSALNEFGEQIDQLSLPLSAENYDIISELGLKLLATAYEFLEKYPWSLIQQFYGLLLHPTPQGFVDWYSNYHIEMRNHLYDASAPLSPLSSGLGVEDSEIEENEMSSESHAKDAIEEDVVIREHVSQTNAAAEKAFEALNQEEKKNFESPSINNDSSLRPLVPSPPEDVFHKIQSSEKVEDKSQNQHSNSFNQHSEITSSLLRFFNESLQSPPAKEEKDSPSKFNFRSKSESSPQDPFTVGNSPNEEGDDE
ncbi:MAG: hypothetical protein ACFFC7_14590 [Candidatus Hermodarchaeota archaeon]